MKRLLSIFVAFCCCSPLVAFGVVNVTHPGVKKADVVKKQESLPIDSATSLLPTVIGLVQDVKNMNVQQQKLTSDCVPTGEEIRLVNDLVKEWAKIGDTDAETAAQGLGVPCSQYTDAELTQKYEDGRYQNYMEFAVDKNETCYERFTGKNNANTIWFKFPKASSAKICDINNPKNCNTESNIYEVFGKISFGVEDYTKSEASKIAKLVEKSQKCAPAKIRAAKRELWGGFLTQTLGNIGKGGGVSGTEAVIQTVSS
ncbi:MAG: hypothetical protein J6S57_01565, partial [Alphaproteobacteria bacterium]|nr:hypothetical protein [Alphaproteobacteria bacterium]